MTPRQILSDRAAQLPLRDRLLLVWDIVRDIGRSLLGKKSPPIQPATIPEISEADRLANRQHWRSQVPVGLWRVGESLPEANRTDIQDSVTWVRNLRTEQWDAHHDPINPR